MPILDAVGRNDTIASSNSLTPKLYPANAEQPIQDAASSFGNPLDSLMSNAIAIDRTTFLERSVAFSKGIISATSADVAMTPSNVSPYYTKPTFPDIGERDDTGSTSFNIEANVDSDTTDMNTALRNATKVIENIDGDRIPCPRMCGASFSFGVGGIAGKDCIFCLRFTIS
jgi:hypothetical protein